MNPLKLKGRHRIFVATTTEDQFRWALRMAHENDQKRMVRIRSLVAKPNVKLGKRDELWILGIPSTDHEATADFMIAQLQARYPFQVFDRPRCRVCESIQWPWEFRRPERKGEPQTRLLQCRACEAEAQARRYEAQKVKHHTVPVSDADESHRESDLYTDELARYLERRRKGETDFV